MGSIQPPETIYFADTGGKTAPFYRTLAGIKSALKTSWYARWNRADWPPMVYKGTVVWEEVDLDGN